MENDSGSMSGNTSVAGKYLREIVEHLDRKEFEQLQSDDPEALVKLASHLDVLILARLRLMESVSRYVLSLPREERERITSALIERIDGREIAVAFESVITAIRIALEENPQVGESLSVKLRDFLSTLDFGKARVGVATAAEVLFSLAERAAEEISKNPVVMANLVGLAPPLINGILRVARRVSESLSLPEEVLASAVFNTIYAIDTTTLAELVNALAARINELHAGNIVLGWDEREFKKVSFDFLSNLAENLDMDLLASSITALGEDASDLLDSFLKVCVSEPATASALAGALLELTTLAAKIASIALEEFLALPESFFEEAVSRAREVYDPAELARVANGISSLVRRFHDVDPEFHLEFAVKFVDNLDLESISSAAGAVFTSYLNAFISRISRDEFLSPEKAGEIASSALRRYNLAFSKKDRDGYEYLSRFIAELDGNELMRTSENVCSAVLRAFEKDPEKVAGIFKPFITTAFKILWRMLTGRFEKLFGSIRRHRKLEV